jgi:ParB family chromosome partitioning protein
LVVGEGEGGLEARRPPKTGFLGSRETRLAEMASGTMVTRVHESIDPGVCRIWEAHNRDYTALNENLCGDLLDSLRAQGRQEVPAIVRRVKGDPTYQYEVVCGARRHWSVTWLRAHDYPDFKFLIEPRELSDEEAFRVADLENRSRKDLSDYERASDYARAIARYYDGSQQRMADRLRVSKSWLSRYLELAKLPTELLACFESPHVIGISHAAALAPSLTHPRDKQVLLKEAGVIAAEQQDRKEKGLNYLGAAQVVARLTNARNKRSAAPAKNRNISDKSGKMVLQLAFGPKGEAVFKIPKARLQDHDAILKAVEEGLSSMKLDR